MDNIQETIKGYVDHIIYRKVENGYTVLVLICGEEEITCVGVFSDIAEGENPGLKPSNVRAGYLEGSNVQVADEMVNMIIAQRAYELNSKAITTADSMLDTANNLKR